MSCRLLSTKRLSFFGLAVAAFAVLSVSGCSRGPSQQELSLLEEKRLAAEAAEKKVANLKSEQARLERKLAEKKAEKKALEEKLQAVEAAVSEWPED